MKNGHRLEFEAFARELGYSDTERIKLIRQQCGSNYNPIVHKLLFEQLDRRGKELKGRGFIRAGVGCAIIKAIYQAQVGHEDEAKLILLLEAEELFPEDPRIYTRLRELSALLD